MNRDEFKNFGVEIKNSRGLVMSRVPKKTKEEFVEFAKEEFADDFGMCFHFLWTKFKELVNLERNQDIKLNYIIELLEKSKPIVQEKNEEKPSIKLLDGRIVKGGKKNE